MKESCKGEEKAWNLSGLLALSLYIFKLYFQLWSIVAGRCHSSVSFTQRRGLIERGKKAPTTVPPPSKRYEHIKIKEKAEPPTLLHCDVGFFEHPALHSFNFFEPCEDCHLGRVMWNTSRIQRKELNNPRLRFMNSRRLPLPSFLFRATLLSTLLPTPLSKMKCVDHGMDLVII
jgi:hypothetical protein